MTDLKLHKILLIFISLVLIVKNVTAQKKITQKSVVLCAKPLHRTAFGSSVNEKNIVPINCYETVVVCGKPLAVPKDTLQSKKTRCGAMLKQRDIENNPIETSLYFVNQKNEPLKNYILSSNIGLLKLDSVGKTTFAGFSFYLMDSLVVTSIGFEKKVITANELQGVSKIVLNEKVLDLKEVVVSGYNGHGRGCPKGYCWLCSKSKKDSIVSKPKRNNSKDFSQINFIFPNPAKSNQNINLSFAEKGNFLVQFIGIDGKILQQQNIKTTTKNQNIVFQAPNINATQIVFVQLINLITKSKTTQSIMIVK
jgi:hypothetical protein